MYNIKGAGFFSPNYDIVYCISIDWGCVQEVKSGLFHKYDYGKDGNMVAYGTVRTQLTIHCIHISFSFLKINGLCNDVPHDIHYVCATF